MAEFRTLGPLEVFARGRALALGSAHQRAVLALLLVQAPEPVLPDRLIDELWGERPPVSALHAVQVYVSGIRKILRDAGGEVAVRSSPSGYALALDAAQIDARQFERLIDEGQRVVAEDPSHARELLADALELWRGPPLAEFGQFEFARREADRLEELRAVGLEHLVEARLACGEHDEVIATITGLVAANPLRERPRRLLMLALYRGGRHAEALGAYRDACAALDEIGLQPGPELRQLEQAILRHDASLLALSVVAGETTDDACPSPVSDGRAGADTVAAGGAATAERADGSAPGRRRKVVTVLSCDVTCSTALGEELDPEVLQGVMNRYFAEVRAAIERHGGTVEQSVGDAVMAVFGIPQLHEDDALRAMRAAVEIREQLPALAHEAQVTLRFRAGLNTGLVLTGEGEDRATGDTVNVAARLEQAAAPGEIVLGRQTLALVRDAVQVEPLEPLALTGKSAPVSGFRLLAVDPLAPGLARRLDAPLIGRERELDVLREAWDRAVREQGCHLFTLLGMAGVGKSRLVAELLSGVGEAATVLRGRCLHYGEGTTFWALAEALTAVAEPAAPVLERLDSGGAAVPQELFWEVRRLLESLALERPVILHIDDLQWAQPMLLDLLDSVTDLSRGAPILLLCAARPELLEDRTSWGGGKLNASAVLLEPLDAADSARLLDQLGDGLDQAARSRVIAASEGNPLFLEEMVGLARERGGSVAVPATIQALLAARLERLGIEERELLEGGAIEGEVFHRLAVCALAGERPAMEVDLRLAGLVRKEVIRPHPATFPEDQAFRFRHLLIRDAAYDGLPKAARAELHERFASWLEQVGGGLSELDEIAGWHLEQAVRYQRELGHEGDPESARRGAEHLYAASHRADERRDVSGGRNLQERALTLAPAGEALAARIAVDLAGRLLESGELDRPGELLSLVEHEPEVAALAGLYRLEWTLHARPHEATQTIESILPDALQRLARAGDERGLARAHLAAYRVHWSAGRVTAAGEAAKIAAGHARAAGDEGLRSHALGSYIAALQQGRRHAGEIARELDAIEREQPGPYLAAAINRLRATLCCLEGRFAQARRLTQLAIDDCDALGMPVRAAVFSDIRVEIEFSAGNPAAALEALQWADARLAQHGERANRSTVQAYLAEAHELLGDPDAARVAIALADELTAPDDVVNYAITHAVRARLALAQGDGAAAERWARSAVEYALGTEFVWDQARARLNLAQVLRLLGRPEDAATEVRAALDLHELKGDRPRAKLARALLQGA